MAKKKPGGLTQAAKLLGAKGGKAGGPARARKMTAEERRKVAAAGGRASKGKPKTGR